MHIHTMSKELDFSLTENCVCFNLRWVTRAMTQFFDAELRRHGIRTTQAPILLALKAKESWTMAELSDVLGVERTTLVRNLRPLQRDGWVTADGGGRGFARMRDDNRAAGDSPETPTLMMLPKLIGVKLTVAYLAFWLVYSVASGILVGWIL